MSGSYLLDTNVAIRILNQQVVLAAFRQAGGQAFLCLTVVGELYFGADRSASVVANRARVDQLIEICPLAPQGLDTARRYGSLKAVLRQKGRPIPENDLWIAACALQHNLVLATHDHHFGEIGELRVEAW
jgi:tRNA(fMet)-specific endonuclease VapC